MENKKNTFRLVMEARGHTIDSLTRATTISSSLISKMACAGPTGKAFDQINLSTFLQLCKGLELRPEELLRVMGVEYYNKR